jgi:hypothetical protein
MRAFQAHNPTEADSGHLVIRQGHLFNLSFGHKVKQCSLCDSRFDVGHTEEMFRIILYAKDIYFTKKNLTLVMYQ